MSTTSHSPGARGTSPASGIPTGWYRPTDCDLDEFRSVVEQTTEPADHPHADEVVQNVVVYGGRWRQAAGRPGGRREVQAEVARVLASGPGIVVFRRAVDPAVVDRATEAFLSLIEEQRRSGSAAGDHFAKPGANDRVWGALDKLAVADPETFAAYYRFDALALVAEAWLGPGYQVTSQVNVVNPGGQAQVAHRDYHLGFMDLDRAASFPAQVHALSPLLTLQGAVAHVDMPVETGPTLYLPHSQKYAAGYLASHDPAFTAYVAEHHVQLPLEKGDAAFFNPAVLHGAGTNRTQDVRRMANLLQISSPLGRAMETVDTAAICRAVHPVLRRWRTEGADPHDIDNVVAVAAEGYPFPTNLDVDQPVDSLVPPTEAELVHRALDEDWETPQLVQALEAQRDRRRSRAAG